MCAASPLPSPCYCPDGPFYYVDDDGVDQWVAHRHCRQCDIAIEEFHGQSLLCRYCHREVHLEWTRWRRAHPNEVRWLREDRVCEECGEPAEQIDHIIPKVAAGTNDLSNLRPICARCNAVKGGSWNAASLNIH